MFGSVAFDITDKLTGTIEGRYSEDLKRIVSSQRNAGGPTTVNLFPARESFNSFTARIVAEYQVNDDFLAYALFARGTKPGGFNGNANRDPQPILALFGGEFWFGMAVVIMGGLAVGTILTLGFVPVLYSLMFRRSA